MQLLKETVNNGKSLSGTTITNTMQLTTNYN